MCQLSCYTDPYEGWLGSLGLEPFRRRNGIDMK